MFIRRSWTTYFTCLILPILWSIYVAQSKENWYDGSVYGDGHVFALRSLPSDLKDNTLVYVDETSGAGASLLTRALQDAGVSSSAKIKQVATVADIGPECPEGMSQVSSCFAAVVFHSLDASAQTLNYTIKTDNGLSLIDVDKPENDVQQERLMPLQWALESTFVADVTGSKPSPPQVWEYTNLSMDDYKDKIRIDFLKATRDVVAIVLIVQFLFVAYQLPGRMTTERAIGLSEHLDVMGCSTLARVLSWHACMSLVFMASWILYGVILGLLVYKHTNMGIMILGCIFAGLSTASWSFLVAVPFEKMPTLAAITSMLLCLLCAVFGRLVGSNVGGQIAAVLFLPPSFFVILMRAAASFEIHHLNTSVTARSPDGDAPIIALFVCALLTVFIYPALSVWLERALFGLGPAHRGLFHTRRQEPLPSGVAVRVDHIRKTYRSRSHLLFGKMRETTAINDLSFDVQKGDVFCLLGRNGSAKSTTLSAIAGLIDVDSGTVGYAPDLRLGIAGQKNVLWDELTPLDHVRLWRAIKGGGRKSDPEGDEALLRRCDLGSKMRTFARNLSGGQKRKLQLACALAGGSDLILLDEVSSGLDPLSRRAIWNVVANHRGSATMILSTHYLDEADYLGDSIAILEAPGRLLAAGGPTELKRAFGHGYTILVSAQYDVGDELRALVPTLSERVTKNARVFHTNSPDVADVGKIVRCLEHRGVKYTVNSTTLEEVFLDLNAPSRTPGTPGTPAKYEGFASLSEIYSEKPWEVAAPTLTGASEADESALPELKDDGRLRLTPGSHRWYVDGFVMVGTFVWKRWLVLRRAWFVPLCAVIAVMLAGKIPLFFLKGRNASCDLIVNTELFLPLSYPQLHGNWTPPVMHVDAPLTAWADTFNGTKVDDAQWMDTWKTQRRQQTYGGMNSDQQQIIAFEGKTEDGAFKGLSLLNMYSNSALQRASPAASGSGEAGAFRINVNFQYLPSPNFSHLGKGMIYMVFFSVAMAVWPAFAMLYPASEKAHLVRENQYSNGARPSALWAGHVLSEVPGILLVSSFIAIVCAAATDQFHAMGLFWLCMVFYGVSATLWGYLITLRARTPVAAFAVYVTFNMVVFLIVFSIYSVILGTDKSDKANEHLHIANLGSAWIAPHASVVRAVVVSLNLFGLLCDGRGHRSNVGYGDMELYGAPLVYMSAQGVIAFLLLVWIDSGRPWLWHRSRTKPVKGIAPARMTPDVAAEASRTHHGCNDTLVVKDLTKVFHKGRHGKKNGAKAQLVAVRDVSFGVEAGELFALIGPNGAGKTTTLALIRGLEAPDRGDVRVDGRSIRGSRNRARAALGVCPQVNAIDPCLTVCQHLWLYARLKGVPRHAVPRDIELLLRVTGLTPKRDALASTLSGGNQRKLLLAMALIGDRQVVLIDEFSSGVDAFSQREAWEVLAALTRDRAVVMTTHSMEEVDALATRIGIIATQLLSVGTPRQLKEQFPHYEVQLPARDVDRCLHYLQHHGFADAYPSPGTTTRISVPSPSVLALLGTLERVQARGVATRNMSLSEASTETAFVEIVSEAQNRESEDERPRPRKWYKCGLRGR